MIAAIIKPLFLFCCQQDHQKVAPTPLKKFSPEKVDNNTRRRCRGPAQVKIFHWESTPRLFGSAGDQGYLWHQIAQEALAGKNRRFLKVVTMLMVPHLVIFKMNYFAWWKGLYSVQLGLSSYVESYHFARDCWT